MSIIQAFSIVRVSRVKQAFVADPRAQSSEWEIRQNVARATCHTREKPTFTLYRINPTGSALWANGEMSDAPPLTYAHSTSNNRVAPRELPSLS